MIFPVSNPDKLCCHKFTGVYCRTSRCPAWRWWSPENPCDAEPLEKDIPNPPEGDGWKLVEDADIPELMYWLRERPLDRMGYSGLAGKPEILG